MVVLRCKNAMACLFQSNNSFPHVYVFYVHCVHYACLLFNSHCDMHLSVSHLNTPLRKNTIYVYDLPHLHIFSDTLRALYTCIKQTIETLFDEFRYLLKIEGILTFLFLVSNLMKIRAVAYQNS